MGIDKWPYKIVNEGIGGVKYSENLMLMVLSTCVLVIFNGCMLSTCCIGLTWCINDGPPIVFSYFWQFTGFARLSTCCIGFNWLMHDSPPVDFSW